MYIIYTYNNYIKLYINLSKFKFVRNKKFSFFLHFPGSLHVTEFINRQEKSSKT